MSRQVIRHVVSLLLALSCLTASAVARAGKIGSLLTLRPPKQVVEGQPVPLALSYTHERPLPFGMRLDLTPELVIARDEAHLGTLLGYSGEVKINAYGELLAIAGKVESHERDARVETEWSVGVTLGAELNLPTRAIARHVLSHARSVLALVL